MTIIDAQIWHKKTIWSKWKIYCLQSMYRMFMSKTAYANEWRPHRCCAQYISNYESNIARGGGGRGRREGLYAGERNGRKLERQFREVCYHHQDFICVQNMFDNHSLSKHSFDHHCFIIQVWVPVRHTSYRYEYQWDTHHTGMSTSETHIIQIWVPVRHTSYKYEYQWDTHHTGMSTSETHIIQVWVPVRHTSYRYEYQWDTHHTGMSTSETHIIQVWVPVRHTSYRYEYQWDTHHTGMSTSETHILKIVQ